LLALRRRLCGSGRQTTLVLRWLKTVVVSVQGYGVAFDRVRWGSGRRSRSVSLGDRRACAVEASKNG